MDRRTEEILVSFPALVIVCYSSKNIKIGSEAHAVSYPMDTRGFFIRIKVTGT